MGPREQLDYHVERRKEPRIITSPTVTERLDFAASVRPPQGSLKIRRSRNIEPAAALFPMGVAGHLEGK
jgi:hypothetical protein